MSYRSMACYCLNWSSFFAPQRRRKKKKKKKKKKKRDEKHLTWPDQFQEADWVASLLCGSSHGPLSLEFPWRIGFSGFVSFIGPLSTISKLTLLSSDCPVDRSFHFNFLTSRPIPLCAILQCQLSISCPQVGYWCTPRIRNVGLLLSLLLPIVLEHVVGHWVPETLCRCFGRHPFAPASSQFLNMASKTVETRIEWRRRRLRCPSYIKSVCLFMLGVIHTDYWHPFQWKLFTII